jgi:predicted outer membrane lipoprotein
MSPVNKIAQSVRRFLAINCLGIVWLILFTFFLVEWLISSEGFHPSLLWHIAICLVPIGVAVWLQKWTLGLSWICLGAILVLLWLRNSTETGKFLLILEFLLACTIFFILEGMELAYTELRDKDPEQLFREKVRRVIVDINQDREVIPSGVVERNERAKSRDLLFAAFSPRIAVSLKNGRYFDAFW